MRWCECGDEQAANKVIATEVGGRRASLHTSVIMCPLEGNRVTTSVDSIVKCNRSKPCSGEDDLVLVAEKVRLVMVGKAVG